MPQEVLEPSILQQCLILVDGINEYAGPALVADFTTFLQRLLNSGAKILVTCRDLSWHSFDDDFFRLVQPHVFRGRLVTTMGIFTHEGVRSAVDRYFSAFSVKGELSGNALDQCRFPLLLRFLCEAYAGQSLGPQSHIRLKDLFDRYLERKTVAIATSLGAGSASNLIAILCDLAAVIFERPGHQITFGELHSLGRPAARIAEHPLYARLLDEHVILEADETLSRGMIIGFVYDEFLEYLFARRLLDSADRQSTGQSVAVLLEQQTSKAELSNIAQYSLMMARDDYHQPIWDEILRSGLRWHGAIVESLATIPTLQPSELNLLLHISDYEGAAISPEARIRAKQVVSRRYSWYAPDQQDLILRRVHQRWSFDQQIDFLVEHIELLAAEEWHVVLRENAADPSALGHESLLTFLRTHHALLRSKHPALLGELLQFLTTSAIPGVRDEARILGGRSI
jgi:hypothetical protein